MDEPNECLSDSQWDRIEDVNERLFELCWCLGAIGQVMPDVGEDQRRALGEVSDRIRAIVSDYSEAVACDESPGGE